MRRGRGRGRRDEGNGFEEWGGYMNAKKQKLQAQFSGDIQREQHKCSTSSRIFEGVTIHVNGYTVPSSDELKRLMQLHGGAYQHYYGKTRVTHIVATMLPHTKLKKLTDEKVVRPEWILDSIEAGELLACEPYLLYNRNSTAQKTLNFSSIKTSDKPKSGNATKDHTQTNSKSGPGPGSGSGNGKHTSPDTTEINQVGGHSNSAETSEFKTPQRTSAVSRRSLTTQQEPIVSKPARTTATAGDPKFVSEFYNNSRLHHISTWGAEFKAYVNSLQSKGSAGFPGRERLKRLKDDEIGSQESSLSNANDASKRVNKSGGQQGDRVMMHVDMDCFFVSVGLIDRPELHGRPVAVTHSKGKGMPVVNQQAREYEKAYYENKYGNRNQQNKDTDISDLLRNGSASAGSSKEECNTDGKYDSEQTENSKVDEQFDNTSLGNVSSNSDEGSSESLPSILSSTTKTPVTPRQSTNESFSSMAEIASCSYEARKAGIKNGMFMGKAKQLCPDLQMIPYDFDGYKHVSHTLYETVASYTHDIEAVSCDEMFVDITSVLEDTGASPLEFAGVLRKEIQEKTQCPASAGLACNLLLARMSTRVAKPNGQFYLQPEAVQDFIKKQPVKDLPGVGWSTSRTLQAMGLSSCDDLQQLSIAVLQKKFGPKTGQSLYQYCRGIDDRPIKAQHARKSVSAEINYGIRFKQDSDAVNFVTELSREVHKRLQAIDMLGKVITLKLKVRQEGAPEETSKFLGHGVCDNMSKSVNLPTPTENVDVITSESVKLLKQVKVSAADMRGVGIQISRLSSKSTATSAATSGNKTLLDFIDRAQSKSDTTSLSNTAIRPSNDTATKETKKPKPHTLLDYIAKQPQSEISRLDHNQNGQTHEILSDGERTDVTPARERKLPPLPVLPDFKTPSESGTPVARVMEREDEFSIPTPSQLDQSVLSALPEDIRCQVLANYKSEDIERINRNRIEDEPSTSTGITGHHTPARQTQQWDPQVLAELPEDILAEIMEGRDQETGEQEVNSEHIEALPNISQIDPSCLEALPPELQQELQSAYEKQTKSVNPQNKTPKKANQPTVKASPKSASKKSPFKINRRRPGRPRKNSPSKKAPQRSANQPGIREMIARSPGMKTKGERAGSSNAIAEERDKMEDVDVEEGKEEDGVRDLQEEDGVRDLQEDMCDADVASYQPVNLCGAVELQDVKKLLKEWMSAFPEPLEEDIHHIVEYLYQLILDRNLEMVDLVLRAVKRLSERCGESAWIEAYSVMEDNVQDIIYETYGSKLKLQSC